jgi:hypothetical protein
MITRPSEHSKHIRLQSFVEELIVDALRIQNMGMAGIQTWWLLD